MRVARISFSFFMSVLFLIWIIMTFEVLYEKDCFGINYLKLNLTSGSDLK